MAYIQGMDRKQTILFPESVDDYIEEDNPVQFVDVFVDSLDLRELRFKYSQPESTGRPPYNPADMLKLYLYGYLNRIRSSRNLEKETRRNIELMWLLKKLRPDFKTIADFRKDNKKAIKKVCREFTLLCKRIELFGGELISIDSSKFKASNSKKQNFNQAKEILEVDELEVLADKGYYNAVEIKGCVDNGLTPYIPETESRVPKKANIPGPEFYNTEFRYDKGRDIYICPGGQELTGRSKFDIKGKVMKLYKSKECVGCQLRGKCTRNKIGRVIYRWEHEDILEDMRRRVEENPEKMKKRQWLSEHPFGTIKRGFDQEYMLTRGIEKVGAEISLSILAYNIKRTINIIGVRKLIAYLRQKSGLLNGVKT